MAKCKHGLERPICYHCKHMAPPLRLFIHRPDESLGLVLSEPLYGKSVKVMLVGWQDLGALLATPVPSHAPDARISWVSLTDTNIETPERLAKEREILPGLMVLMRCVAMKSAHAFDPSVPLEERETNGYGPPTCWDCRESLGYGEHSLGCELCKYYICSGGICFCGWPGGYNYRGQYFPCRPAYPYDREDRQDYLRVARSIAADGSLGEST